MAMKKKPQPLTQRASKMPLPERVTVDAKVHRLFGAEQKQRDRKVIAAYHSGTTFADIGKRFGITKQRVNQILDANNVPRHAHPYPRKDCSRYYSKVLSLHDARGTISFIARQVNISQHFVRVILRTHNRTPHSGSLIRPHKMVNGVLHLRCCLCKRWFPETLFGFRDRNHRLRISYCSRCSARLTVLYRKEQ